MKIPALKQGQVVALDWSDSKSALGWLYNPKLQRKPGYVHSLGFVVQVNDECLTISTSMDKAGASLDDLSIPIGCITKIEVLPEDWNLVAKKEGQ